VGQDATALTLFVVLALVYIGRWALPSPAGGTIGAGPDVQVFLWGLRWWPFALSHGLDPLVSHVVWAPYGSNVLWTTTVPLLSLLAAPVTLTLGPAVAWNLLCVLAPALSAWGAYLLCRELTGRWLPSLLGGALFGFSSYELAQGMAHLQMTMTVCVPLSAWVLVRHMHGRIGTRGLAIRVTALAVAQFLISPEILATLVLSGVVALAAAYVGLPRLRPQLATAAAAAALGLAAADVLLSPLLISMLSHLPANPNSGVGYSADLANLVVPTPITAASGDWGLQLVNSFPGNAAERGAYLGLPLLAIVLAFGWRRRAAPRTRLLLALLTVSILLSLGSHLQIGGHQLIWLPAALLRHVPLLDAAQPVRFAMFSTLVAAVIAACWLAEANPRPAGRWLVAGLALVSIAPNPGAGIWWKPTPTTIADGGITRAVPRGAEVISLPFWNPADSGLYAQAAADMRFSMDDSWLQLMPDQYRKLPPLAVTLTAPGLAAVHSARQAAALERTLCRMDVDYALVWTYGPRLLAGLRLTPAHAGNALVYRLPSCPGDQVPAARRYRATAIADVAPVTPRPRQLVGRYELNRPPPSAAQTPTPTNGR